MKRLARDVNRHLFHKRLCPKGQSTHEKLLRLISHYGNSNLNYMVQDFPGGAVVKNPPASARDTGSSPGLGRSHMLRSN